MEKQMNKGKAPDPSGREPLQKVLDGGYCIGCGVCTAASPATFSMIMDEAGQWQAVQETAPAEVPAGVHAAWVCPFTDAGPNEDAIGRECFGKTAGHDPRFGFFQGLYAGYVAESDYRNRGTSGGVLTWVLTELMKTNRIDAVIQVKAVENPKDGILFRYGISRSVEAVQASAKSRYYPIELSRVLEEVRRVPGRYALVGLPCFIKAVRRLMVMDPVIKERIPFTVGLVCGHLKSKAFADCFGWQSGIAPGKLEAIDFRVKLPDRSAGNYGVRVKGSGIDTTRPTRDYLGSNWGHNVFRYEACDACDDVFAETADVSIGDAWLPAYEQDPKGNSVVVVRHPEIGSLIEQAWTEGRLHLDRVDEETMAASQAGGLRDRREGLAYRLWLKQKQGRWAPKKRVVPSAAGLSWRRRAIYRSRSQMAAASHQAWQSAVATGDLQLFSVAMTRRMVRHERLYIMPLRRLRGWLGRLLGLVRPGNGRKSEIKGSAA